MWKRSLSIAIPPINRRNAIETVSEIPIIYISHGKVKMEGEYSPSTETLPKYMKNKKEKKKGEKADELPAKFFLHRINNLK